MNRYLKLHLKIFLGTGIPFGIFMGIFHSLEYGFPLGLVAGLFREGIIFGVFMSLILGFMHSWSVKRMPYGKSEESLGNSQIIIYPLLNETSFQACLLQVCHY